MQRKKQDSREDSSGNSRFLTRRRRRLFDSVFAKYISAFVLIIFGSFLMIAVIITGVLGGYARHSKSRLATSAATETALFIENEMKSGGVSDIGDFVLDSDEMLSSMLSVIVSSADGDMTVFLTDAEANVILFVDRFGKRVDVDATLPKELYDDVVSGLEISHVGSIAGLSDTQQLVKAQVVRDANGAVCGTVFACASSDSYEALLAPVMKTLLLSGLWVLIVSLVAVYILTERIIGPLREMSRAAKSFAAGDFEVTVPVKGNDEVAQLAEAFNQMATSLKNLEKMRSTFMANVSHDLRTPMTTIAGFIDSILAGAIPQDKHAHYLGIVSGEVKRLSRLVSLTLDISRIQAGDRKFVMAQFDICEMARLILISFEQKIENKRLIVEFDSDEDNMTVYADRDAIYQILYNICDNAVKFSREGGRLEIAIRAQREKKKVLVTVLNEGQGIPSEDLPYVFDQFYKGDKSRGLDKSGVGLGMFISKAIVDAHKEEIWVHSEYGKNCEFGFTLSSKPPHQKGSEHSRT